MSRSTYVHPTGPRDAKIAFVFEQPDKFEVRQGRPLVGPAGREFDDCLINAGISRSECYLTNVIKDLDYPLTHYFIYKQSRIVGTTKAGQEYIYELEHELGQVSANVIVPSGNVALFALASRTGITKWRGSIIESTLLPGKKLIPAIHTATVIPPKSQYLNKHLITLDYIRAREQAAFPDIRTAERSLITGPSFIQCLEFLSECLYRGHRGSIIDYDIEIDINNYALTCISFAMSPHEGISIPFLNHNGDYFTPDQEATIMLAIARILEDKQIQKRGQNVIAFDGPYMLRMYGIKMHNCHDTMVAQKILLPDYPVGLHFITTMFTEIPYYKDDGKQFIKAGGEWQKFWTYNIMDSIACAEAHPKQLIELDKQHNLPTYERQCKLLEPLAYMMEKGIKVDVEGLLAHRKRNEIKLKELEEELWSIVGYQINWQSSKQLLKYLYEEQKYPVFKSKNQKGQWVPSTDVNAIKRLIRRGIREATLLRDLRHVSKQNAVYANLDKIDDDGRYRSSYNPAKTATGRLASSESIWGKGGNQQNWPHELLTYLTPDEGYMYYGWDLAQAENRIVAYVGRILEMIEAFESGIDLHMKTAALIFNKPIEEISCEPGSCELGSGEDSERDWGKKGNHSLNYDFGYRSFAMKYEMPEAQAKWIVDRYHAAYPGVRKSYHALVKAMLSKDRTVINCMGRRRLFMDKWGDQLWKDAYAQIPQSTVADVINERGLIFTYFNQDLFGPVELLTQIHDNISEQISMSLPWTEHAKILLRQKQELEIPLQWNDRSFVIPADLVMGFNLNKNDGYEIKAKAFPTTVEELAKQLEAGHATLMSKIDERDRSA